MTEPVIDIATNNAVLIGLGLIAGFVAGYGFIRLASSVVNLIDLLVFGLGMLLLASYLSSVGILSIEYNAEKLSALIGAATNITGVPQNVEVLSFDALLLGLLLGLIAGRL